MVFVSDYKRCPSCKKIMKDTNHKLAKLGETAPCCGVINESFVIWPSLEAHLILKVIYENHDLSRITTRNITAMNLCIVLEYLLEQAIKRLLEGIPLSKEEIDKELIKCRGWANRVKLFNKISPKELKEIIESDKLTGFISKWTDLVQIRNKIAHGSYISTNTDRELIEYMREHALGAFAKVENSLI